MSNNRTLGSLALLMAFTILWFGWGLKAPFAYEPVGPRAFPLITACLIGFCGLVLVIRGGGHIEGNSASVNLGLVGLSVILLVYALIFVWAGFIVATALMAFASALLFGARWHQALISALALSIGAYLLFDRVLDVVLPKGLLGGLL